MIEGERTGIFGLGPGSIDPITDLDNAHILFKEPKGPRSVYTTSIGHEELFDRYVPQQYLQPMRTMRVMTTRGTDFTVPTGNNYYMVDYTNLLSHWRNQIQESKKSFEVIPDTVRDEDIHVRERDGVVSVEIDGGYYEFDAVVDATGIQSVISTKVERNRQNEDYVVEYVCLGTFKGQAKEGELTLVFGPGGGTSWVNPSTERGPNGEPLIDIVFSGWGHKSQFERFTDGEGRRRLADLKNWIENTEGFTVYGDEPLDVTYGMIRSQKIPLPESQCVYPVGESAGVAKPLTGESFNRSLNSGRAAAEHIEEGKNPRDYVKSLQKQARGTDIFYTLTLLTMERQLQGKSGLTMDALHRLFNNANISDSFVKQMEDFVIKGRISSRFMLTLIKDPVYRNLICTVIGRTLVDKMTRSKNFPSSHWAFPEM